jgi:predicted nucleic acid-binding protein
VSVRYLLDTSIVIRAVNPQDPQQSLAMAAIAELKRRDREPVLTPQVVVESWAVGTRPVSNNGLGWTPFQMGQRIDKLIVALGLSMLSDVATVYDHWRSLVERHAVSGKQVHDARLVAVMLTHGVLALLTFNDADFRR